MHISDEVMTIAWTGKALCMLWEWHHRSEIPEMCSERDSPLEPFVLPAPGQPELARLTCGAHLGPPVLTRKQKRPRVNSLVCDRAAAFCAAGPPEALSWMSHLVTQAAKREQELARAHSQRLKQVTLSLPGESVSRGFADRGALEGYPSHYTSLEILSFTCQIWSLFITWLVSMQERAHLHQESPSSMASFVGNPSVYTIYGVYLSLGSLIFNNGVCRETSAVFVKARSITWYHTTNRFPAVGIRETSMSNPCCQQTHKSSLPGRIGTTHFI